MTPPPNNIWRLSSFSKQIWVVPPPPALNPSKVFSDPPLLLGSQLRLIPPSVLLKSSDPPKKILPQVMNNHRSLMVILFPVSRSHHWRHDRLDIRGLRSCTFLLCGAPAKELLRWGICSPTRQNNPRGARNVCRPKSSHKEHGIMKKEAKHKDIWNI